MLVFNTFRILSCCFFVSHKLRANMGFKSSFTRVVTRGVAMEPVEGLRVNVVGKGRPKNALLDSDGNIRDPFSSVALLAYSNAAGDLGLMRKFGDAGVRVGFEGVKRECMKPSRLSTRGSNPEESMGLKRLCSLV